MDVVTIATALADTTGLGEIAARMCGRCQATGLVAFSYRRLIGTAHVLGVPYMAMLHAGVAWRTDVNFVNVLIDLECDIYNRLVQVNNLIVDLENQIAGLWAIYDETPETEWCLAQIGVLQGVLQILYPALSRLKYALQRIQGAPDELGETYAAAYRHVRSGRKLPFNGRWLTADGADALLLNLPR
ncbi:hypothetical protein ACQP2T_28000 [Nonomuraea sp. CA-143628]|uniref:hypothetical protein n=1 Tax=Nonomuraea sp. CA-143628 TaxID=3239997 RepID=UPI003D8A13AD